MKRIILFLCIVLTLFLVGCSGITSNAVVCSKPYTRQGSGCCIDENGDGICDLDAIRLKQKAEEKQRLMDESLEKAKQEHLQKIEEKTNLVKETQKYCVVSTRPDIENVECDTMDDCLHWLRSQPRYDINDELELRQAGMLESFVRCK